MVHTRCGAQERKTNSLHIMGALGRNSVVEHQGLGIHGAQRGKYG